VKYAQEDVTVKIDVPNELPFIFGQRHQLIQIFSNILLNAFQALEGTGEILISANHLNEDQEQWLEIVITDNGPGMPYEVQEHIFEPFYSTRQHSDSTGLGLYIAKSIVESLGGTIEVQSIPKHGTSFTIRLPISEEEVG
jgi:two-component system NtrC family sensor kinase